jgi:hypothetical protein
VTVETVFPSGAIRCSTIRGGYWESRDFMGYSRREAVSLFLDVMNDGETIR